MYEQEFADLLRSLRELRESQAKTDEILRASQTKTGEELRASRVWTEEELRASRARTDEELRASRARTEEEFRLLRASQAKTDEELRASRARMEEEYRLLRESQAKTDEELRASRARTDEEFRLLRASQAKTDEELRASRVRMEEEYRLLRESQAKTDEMLRESQAKTDEVLRESQARVDKALDRLAQQVGQITEGHGAASENFFWHALKNYQEIGGIKINNRFKNLHLSDETNQIRDEIDIILLNGEAAILIEVKYRVKKSDIMQLRDKKIANFKKYYDKNNKYKIYAGIAGFTFEDEMIEIAKANGLFALHQSGDNIVIESDELKSF